MQHSIPLIIDGEELRSPTGHKIEVRNASQDRVVGHAEAADVQSITKAVESAAKAFTSWRDVNPSTRREILLKTATRFEETQDILKASLREETSCTEEWAMANIMGTLKSLRELACSTSAVHGEIPLEEDNSRLSLIFQVPVGAVLVIAP